MRSSHLLSVLGFCSASLLVTGCSMTSTAVNTPVSGAALQGVLHGGQQGITASHIYVMQAGTGGYGGPSTSLLQPGLSSGTDAIGSYVLSMPGGLFTIPAGSYACSPGAQVYLYALGGDPGAGANSAAGLLAVLGNCPSSQTLASQTPQVLVNEVSTIAGAYAIAGYATDATHVSSSGSPLAQIGIRNAFANAAQLVTLSTGIALTQTPNGNGTVPQKLIYTLANILAACVNSSGPSTGGCTGLFGAVKSGGLTGTVATDTATSAIYIAHHPGVSVSTLYPLASTQPPFAPALTGTTPPNDFTIGINYTGSGINHPEGIAIDTLGYAWITNTNGNSVTKLSPTGVPATGTPFTDSSLKAPQGIAIDTLGVAWVTNFGGNSLTKISNSGSSFASTTAGGNIALPGGVAIDSLNAAWVTSLAGGPTPALLDIAPSLATYTAYPVGVGGLNVTQGVAVDYTLHQWITNGSGTVTELLAGLRQRLGCRRGSTAGRQGHSWRRLRNAVYRRRPRRIHRHCHRWRPERLDSQQLRHQRHRRRRRECFLERRNPALAQYRISRRLDLLSLRRRHRRLRRRLVDQPGWRSCQRRAQRDRQRYRVDRSRHTSGYPDRKFTGHALLGARFQAITTTQNVQSQTFVENSVLKPQKTHLKPGERRCFLNSETS
jgi:hypothetical protein